MKKHRLIVIAGLLLSAISGHLAVADPRHDLLLRIIKPFGECMTGPGPGVVIPSGCSIYDKKGDGDLEDWRLLEARR